MDINIFVKKAKEKGFDTVASLSIPEAEAAIAQWKTYLRDGDFNRLNTDPREILPEAASLLLLTYPYCTFHSYPDGIGRVSGYYVASNRAYHASDELADWLRSEGVRAVRTHNLPQKPLARAAGLGRYGRNGVIIRSGSHIVLCLIVIDAAVQLPVVNAKVPDCENCGACEKACPTGCLVGGYVNANRCLRSYMTFNVDDIPDDMRPLMGERILGCDECLNVCPGLKQEPMPDNFNELFAWDALADEETFAKNRAAIAEIIGTNEAGRMHESALRHIKF